jgi:membrane-associated phospholipid phosphatase
MIAVLALFAFFRASDGRADNSYGDDELRYLLPLYAAGLSVWKERSYPGVLRLFLSAGGAQLASEGLKRVTNRKRPLHKEGDKRRSFPSGHAAAGFSAAMFIHKRYDLKQAAVPYVLAAWTAYARVHRKRHHVEDVIGSFALSGLFTWIFVKPHEPEPGADETLAGAFGRHSPERYVIFPEAFVSGDGIYLAVGFNF